LSIPDPGGYFQAFALRVHLYTFRCREARGVG
jgi:hypothetical protein